MRKIFFILFVFFATFCFVKNEVSSDDDEDNVRVNPLHILKGLTIDSWIIDALSIIVLGPTGVGKSTLVNFLAGFLLKPIESSRSVNKLYVVDLEENSGEVTTKIGYEIHS
jgi:putative ribosome biogenesis GTPase RsgA